MLPGNQGTAAGRAGRGGDKGVVEKDPLFRDAVEVRCADDIVCAARAVERGVCGGMATPIVGEKENDVRAVCAMEGCGEEEGCE